MEPEDSIPNSPELSTCSYPEPNFKELQLHIFAVLCGYEPREQRLQMVKNRS
jgi:hypothetical protein